MFEENSFDWAMGEAVAFGSLLLEGMCVCFFLPRINNAGLASSTLIFRYFRYSCSVVRTRCGKRNIFTPTSRVT